MRSEQRREPADRAEHQRDRNRDCNRVAAPGQLGDAIGELAEDGGDDDRPEQHQDQVPQIAGKQEQRRQ